MTRFRGKFASRLLWKTALLVGLGAALPACQIWNAWLDALKWRDDPKLGENNQPRLAVNNPDGSAAPANGALIPRVMVYRITLPVGAFSTNDKIWSQLNEDALDSKTAVLMAQNGLRAGTGNIARWPAISKQLDVPGAQVTPQICQTDGNSSINVLTRPGVTDQIVVSVDHDQQMQGRTFEACDNSFRLTMRGVRGRAQLQVQLEPVVTLGAVAVQRPGQMGIVRQAFTSEESFPDLRISTLLTAEQFLVVSAMDPKASEFSVGTLWLSDKERAPATETVLVFVPAGNGAAAGAAAAPAAAAR